MIRKWLLAALVLSVLPLSAADVKIGYVFSDQVMKEYKGMTEPNTLLSKEKSTFRQKADSLYQLTIKAKADFEEQKLVLSEEGKVAKNAELAELQRRYDSYITDVYGPNGKLEQKTQEIMAPVVQKIREGVARIAQSDGYTLVFDAAESKLAILYAAAGANLTGLVLEELNREYKPVEQQAVGEKRYAVCPLTEGNDEAQQGNLGDLSRGLVYEVLRAQPRIQMVSTSDMNTALLNRGMSGKANITDDVAYSVGNDLQADLIFFGSLTRTGKKITVTLKMADPRMKKLYPAENGIANRQEELKVTLGNMVTKLLKQLPKE